MKQQYTETHNRIETLYPEALAMTAHHRVEVTKEGESCLVHA